MQDEMQELWDIEELASFLKKSKASIYSDLKRNPEVVPPPIRLPGTNRLRWDPRFVREWARKYQTGILPMPEESSTSDAPGIPPAPAKRGRGRPRKMEMAGVSHG